MGLDVYLYRFEDQAETARKLAEYEQASGRAWNYNDRDYGMLTEDEKAGARAACEAAALAIGLDKDGSEKEDQQRKIEIPHPDYPDHYFKIGYFRSSYNNSGIEGVLRAKGCPTLHDIFAPGDRYEFQPDWRRARDEAAKSLAALRARNLAEPYRAFFVEGNPYGDPARNEAEAVAAFMNGTRRPSSDFIGGQYSSRDGYFNLPDKDGDPPNILAMIHGTQYDSPGVWAVYKSDGLAWYEQAMEIVIATCDYVLAQPDTDKYWLHWSS